MQIVGRKLQGVAANLISCITQKEIASVRLVFSKQVDVPLKSITLNHNMTVQQYSDDSNDFAEVYVILCATVKRIYQLVIV